MLGRRPAPDPRDASYPLRLITPPSPTRPRPYRNWSLTQPCLDQGVQGTCVGHAWKHWLMSAPVVDLAAAPPAATDIYDLAVTVDEWPDNDTDPYRQFGTSVRAGAKVLQSQGRIISYHWAVDMADIVDYLSTTGPVVLGTNWYQRMFAPDADGYLKAEGEVMGGHAYLLVGVNRTLGRFTMINSWGRGWGRLGRAYMHFGTVDRLVFSEGGEACAALEQRLPKAPLIH
jgi:hypothetical protein